MPGPLRELRLSLFAAVETLPAALNPVGGGQDSHRGRIVWYDNRFFFILQKIWFTWDEAADIVIRESAVGVGGPATGSNKPLLQFYATIPRKFAFRKPLPDLGN